MILVVDDDEGVRELAVDLLEGEGYEVRAARSGEEGLALVEADETIRLLFTDIMMPGIDGWELARRAKQVRPDLRVLYMSGFTRSLPAAEQSYGPLLAKPWRVADLFRHVQNALK